MKVLLIVLGIIAALGLACCGGLFLVGRNVVNTANDGMAFAESSVKAMATSWDPKEFESRTSDELKQVSSVEGRAKVMYAGQSQLGKLVKLEPLRATGFNSQTDTGKGAATTLTFLGSGKFELGEADFTISVVKAKDKWAILSFEIRPTKQDMQK